MEQERKEKKIPKILIVDDIDVNVAILENIVLEMGYEPLCALSVQEALDLMDTNMPQLILSDYAMPGLSGLEFCKLLKSNPVTREIPVVFITVADSAEERKQAYEAGVIDFIHKPFEKQEVVLRIKNQLAIYYTHQELEDYNRMMHTMLAEQKQQLEQEQEKFVLALAKVIERRSAYPDRHLKRLGYNCRILAQSMQLVYKYENKITDEFIDTIETAAKLCDVGNIVIADEVFEKDYASEQEKQEMIAKMQVDEGSVILEEICDGDNTSRFLDMAVEIVKYYHANWDGNGYPAGAAGEEIPLAARITRVVNDFDTLLTKTGHSAEENIEFMGKSSGTLYDPDVLEIFHKVLKQMQTD